MVKIVSGRRCALHMVVVSAPDTPRFGVFHSPSELYYYRDARVTQVAVVSETEQHVWDVDVGSGRTSDDFCATWNQMLIELMDVLDRYDVLVGYYMVRDMHVFTAELYRRKLTSHAATFYNKPYECVMYSVVLPNGIGSSRGQKCIDLKSTYPTLLDVYASLYPSAARHCSTEPTNVLDRCKMIFDCAVKINGLKHEPVFNATLVTWGRRHTRSLWQSVVNVVGPAVRRLRSGVEM